MSDETAEVVRNVADYIETHGRWDALTKREAVEEAVRVCCTPGDGGGAFDSVRRAALAASGPVEEGQAIDAAHLAHQREWSTVTFGPGLRLGVIDHIRKELVEVEDDPTDLTEWVDVIILGFDGAWRAGHEPQQIIDAIKAKQARNEARSWPDWRTADRDKAIEHDRSQDRDPVGDGGGHDQPAATNPYRLTPISPGLPGGDPDAAASAMPEYQRKSHAVAWDEGYVAGRAVKGAPVSDDSPEAPTAAEALDRWVDVPVLDRVRLRGVIVADERSGEWHLRNDDAAAFVLRLVSAPQGDDAGGRADA